MILQPATLKASRRLFAAAALLVTLGGCAAPKMLVAPGTDAWNGRLALNVASSPPQSYTAGFDLHGTPQAGELLLATPLGSTLATITWGPDFAQMTQGSQVTRRSSLAELSADMGGTEVPVAALFAWLKGESATVAGWQADLSRHAEGRVTAKRTIPLPAAELRLVFEP
ncbi:MAG TPA: lipoprotein insertase outer membrane protein LolB [Hydrogenophaga sp.]